MMDLRYINGILSQENIRHLPNYAIEEIIEELILILPPSLSQEEQEILREIKYFLKHSPICRGLIDELLT